MEYIEYEYNFGEFQKFLEDHKSVLYEEDYLQYLNLAIKHHNIKIICYIINNNLLDDKVWNDYIGMFFEYEMKDCLQLLLHKNIDINKPYENSTLFDYLLVTIVCNKDNFREKILYLLYVIDKGGKCNLDTFFKQLESGIMTEDNLSNIICVADILILYNFVKIKLDDYSEEIKLLFSNIDKNIEDIVNKFDDNVINIFYEYYEVDNKEELLMHINKISIISKSGWSDDELFIYFDGKNNWCFGKEDIRYIKNTKMNPLNDTNIQDYIIDLM